MRRQNKTLRENRERIGETMTRDQNEGITGQTKPKQVFISYSHDSELHKARVKKLADQLTQEGISCILDLPFQARKIR